MLDNIKQFIKDNLYLTIVILFSLLVGIFLIWYGFIFNTSLAPKLDQDSLKADKNVTRLIDGVYVVAGEENLRPAIVMIENHYDSRPVAGLENAGIIYETIVEGDITRFLAIFDPSRNIKRIGPVRSARPFFVDITNEWNGVYFHAGGSQEALDQLKKNGIDRINEISADGIFFWRDINKFAPHNLFTSSQLIERAINAKGFATTTVDFSPWLFKDPNPINFNQEVKEIHVPFSENELYYVIYKYNLGDNNYTRYLNGEVHKTESGIILKTDNVVKQFVDSNIVDSYGRRSINLENGGEAIIYQDGREINGYWEKIEGRTRFFDNNDEEIRFNRGKIWVELVFN